MKPSKDDCDHMLHRYILAAALFVLLFVFVDHVAFAQSNMGLRAYGSGGPAPAVPAPAMKEAAKAFEQKIGTPVSVTAGPTAE